MTKLWSNRFFWETESIRMIRQVNRIEPIPIANWNALSNEGFCLCNFWQVGDTEFDGLMSYDDKCFIRPGSAWRREFMSRWVKIPGGRAMMAVNQQGDVVGYGCRRPAKRQSLANYHIIGPLYADSYEIAWDLLQQLTRDVIGQNIEMTTM